MQRLTCGKLYLRFTCGNPTAALNHHQHNITSAAKRTVGTARCDRKLGDLRDVVREDGATENTLGARSAIGTSVTGAESANIHDRSQCATAHTNGLPATIRWSNGRLDPVGNLTPRAQECGMLRLSSEEWRGCVGCWVVAG